MIVVDAALLVALVLGTGAHPGATFLAAGVVGAGLELLALDLLIHVAATALDQSGLVARWTFVQVASGVADVVCSGRATRKLLSTDGLANWDRVQTGFAFSFYDGLLSAGTRCDDLRGNRALATRSPVASFSTVVIFASELCIANLSTTEASLVQVVNRARDLFLFFSAVAFVLQGFLAFATRPAVAPLLAGVDSAVQRPFTGGIAKDLVLLAALHRFGGPAAAATSLDHRLARWARPGVTKLGTSMLASLQPTAQVPTGMGHVASVELGIPFLAAEAVVLPRDLLGHVLAGRAAPPVVGFRTAGPFGRTGQVQNVVAIRAGPNGLCRSHQIATDQAFQLAGVQLPDELLPLRALGDDLRLQLLLAGPIPLVSIWPTVVFPFRRVFRRSIVAVVIALGLVPIVIRRLLIPSVPKTSTSSVSLPSSIRLRLLLLLLRCPAGSVEFP